MTAKQSRLVGMLLKGMSMTDACAEIGISRMTGYRWLNDDNVTAALEEGKKTIFDIAIAEMVAKASVSVEIMYEIATNKDVNPQTRLVAARAMLLDGVKLTELISFADRIAEIEKDIDKLYRAQSEGGLRLE